MVEKIVQQAKLADFEKRLTEERKKRLADRKEKRKEERRTKWINAKLEAEQRRKDEELKRRKYLPSIHTKPNIFVHSFILAISIAPLRVHYYHSN